MLRTANFACKIQDCAPNILNAGYGANLLPVRFITEPDEPRRAQLKSDDSNISVPHLSGIFLSINSETAKWTKAQWVADLQAMKDVGISFFCPRAAANGVSSTPNASCPLGAFKSFYHSTRNPCFEPVAGMPPGGAYGTVLEAASIVGLKVHLGLAWPSDSVLQSCQKPPANNSHACPDGLQANLFRQLAWLEWEVAQELWQMFGERHRETIVGVYTMLEEGNGVSSLNEMLDLRNHYLEPLARDIKTNISAELLVWASPYYVSSKRTVVERLTNSTSLSLHTGREPHAAPDRGYHGRSVLRGLVEADVRVEPAPRPDRSPG